MEGPCPDLASTQNYTYYAPSFAGTGGNSLDPIVTWEDGLDTDKDIAVISTHKFVATHPHHLYPFADNVAATLAARRFQVSLSKGL